MWTPADPVDVQRLTTLTTRLLGSHDLMNTLCRGMQMSDDQATELDNFLGHMENIADTYGDVAGELLDMLHKHED